MSLGIRKEKGGWAVFEGREALVRGLREKRDAHAICYDIRRKGFFRGKVTFARGGKVLEVTVPADQAGWVHESDRGSITPGERPGTVTDEGTVDDL